MQSIELEIKTLGTHDLANTHRLMSEKEYKALLIDIENNGQVIPILVYRNKIVDGRHRCRALSELGIENVRADIIPNNTTLSQIKEIVMSTENRRTNTPAQKSIQAFKYQQKNGGKNKDIADKFGVRPEGFSQLKYIEAALGSDLVDEMYVSGFVEIGGKGNKKRFTNIKTLYTFLKNTYEPAKATIKEHIPDIDVSEDLQEGFDVINRMLDSNDIVSLAILESFISNARKRD